MTLARERLLPMPARLSTFGTKCAWFGGTIRAVCTIAALHRLFGMSSSQSSTTTKWFGLRPLLAARAALIAALWQLMQGLMSLTRGDGRFEAVVHTGRWIAVGSGAPLLAAVAPASWFPTTGGRNGPAPAPWHERAWPVPASCYCETSTVVEQAFVTRQGRCRPRS